AAGDRPGGRAVGTNDLPLVRRRPGADRRDRPPAERRPGGPPAAQVAEPDLGPGRRPPAPPEPPVPRVLAIRGHGGGVGLEQGLRPPTRPVGAAQGGPDRGPAAGPRRRVV